MSPADRQASCLCGCSASCKISKSYVPYAAEYEVTYNMTVCAEGSNTAAENVQGLYCLCAGHSSLVIVCCSSTAPAADRVRPVPRLTLSQPSMSLSGLPPWWEPAVRAQQESDRQAEPVTTSPAAAAERAATLLRVIVNVRINGREPKVRTHMSAATWHRPCLTSLAGTQLMHDYVDCMAGSTAWRT